MPNRGRWTRREALGMLGAAVALPVLRASRAAGAGGGRNIIDVHAHYQPPAIRSLNLPGPMNAWDLQKQIDDMDAAGVTRAVLSVTTPGVPATGEAGRRIARESNEYAAKLAADHGRRFGFFTCVPMDDMDAALNEVAYGFDVLKAQGVGLFTSYSGRWLGDAQFDPLFAELERRGAIVYRAPDQRGLLYPSDSGSGRHAHRVRNRHHPRHRQLRVPWRGAAIPERADDLEPLGRHHAVSH